MATRSTMRHSHCWISNYNYMVFAFLALVLFLPNNDRFQVHAAADAAADVDAAAAAAAVQKTKNDELAQYLYLKEPKADVYPIDEFKSTAPDGRNTQPDFLCSPDYPNYRVVEFYAHWCPHCKNFKPKYIEFARKLQRMTSKLNITIETRAVSCVPNKKMCNDMKIKSYPMIKLFPPYSAKGTVIPFFGLNTSTALQFFNIPFVEEPETEEPVNITAKTEMKINKLRNFANNKPITASTTATAIKPIVFMDRTQQDMYNDAHLSFTFALQTAIFIFTSEALEPSPKAHLKDFLHALQNGLPPSMSLQPLLADLVTHYEDATSSDEHLQHVVSRHPAPSPDWSPSCLKHDSGYTCGLWQLFHIMSIGIVEWNQIVLPLANSEDLIMPPMGVADALRNYISDFFGCDDCRTHFINAYDACEHDRCNRLMDHNQHSDWIELPLWLYETHNGVNVRLRKERIAEYNDHHNGKKEESTEQDVLWPPKAKCPQCWLSDGRWDEQMVYLYMRLEYWYVVS
jgi:thiol-disulfide isomerase/thioredoxin